MAVLVIAALNFTDEARYRRYQAGFMDVFRRFDGELVAADESPKTLEGDANFDKVVVMRFPNEEAANAFINSAAYRAISEDRRAGAVTQSLMIRTLV